jgi:molybdopterin-guanine dinucleotide biosynthesis protein A
LKRDDISAFVLAGGRSSRMGRDKAFLQLHGRTLLDHALQTARSVATNVSVVGQREKFGSYGEVVQDTFRERGPLGGIHAALRASKTDLNLILAVDTPFVGSAVLEYLINVAETSGKLVAVPRVAGHLQTLCAVYRREFAEIAEKSLNAGKNRIDPLFTPDVAQVISEEEMQALAFDPAMFDNLNTPEEYERALARLADQSPHGH